MTVRKKLKLFISMGLWALIIAACGIFDLQQEDIVGLWVEYQFTCERREVSSCATIEFYSDGRFEARNFPIKLLGSINYTDAQGTWSISAKEFGPFADYQVKLEFEPNEDIKFGLRSSLFINIEGDLFRGVDVVYLMLQKCDAYECY